MSTVRARVVCVGWLSALALVAASLFQTVAAKSQQFVGGITVSPAQLSLNVSKDTPESSQDLTVSNNYDTPVTLSAELRAIDESSARLVPAGKIGNVLANALNLSEHELTVPARGKLTISIVARNVPQLSPGGHYVSLMLSEEPISHVGSVFRGAVSVNIFLTQSDSIKRDIQLEEVKTDGNIFRMPRNVTFSFRNGGNTHIVPRASVGYYDADTQIGRAVLNQDSQILFPSRRASFTAPVQYFGNPVMPRHIRQDIMYRIDGTDVQLLRHKTFWYIPIIDILILLLVVEVLWLARKHIQRISYRWLWRAAKRVLRSGTKLLYKAIRRIYVFLVRRQSQKRPSDTPVNVLAPQQEQKNDDTYSSVGPQVAPVAHRAVKIEVIAPIADASPSDIVSENTPKPEQDVPAKVKSGDTKPVVKTRKPRATAVTGRKTATATKKTVKKSEKTIIKKQTTTKPKAKPRTRGKTSK